VAVAVAVAKMSHIARPYFNFSIAREISYFVCYFMQTKRQKSSSNKLQRQINATVRLNHEKCSRLNRNTIIPKTVSNTFSGHFRIYFSFHC